MNSLFSGAVPHRHNRHAQPKGEILMPDSEIAHLFWQQYPLLQPLVDRYKADSYAWAAEEVLEEYLDRLAGGNPELPPLTQDEVEHLPDRFRARVWNRLKKFGRRRKILLAEYPHQAGRPVCDVPQPTSSTSAAARSAPSDRLIQNEDVAQVRLHVTPDEWGLLWSLAEGTDYEALSRVARRPVGTLKSVASRCRRRLRMVLAAAPMPN